MNKQKKKYKERSLFYVVEQQKEQKKNRKVSEVFHSSAKLKE